MILNEIDTKTKNKKHVQLSINVAELTRYYYVYRCMKG